MSTILVTGGAGFIGSHIADAAIAAGHRVVVVDNLSHGRRENVHPAARFYQLDLCQADALAEVFAAERPEFVCHQAALASVRESLERPEEYARVNIQGGITLLELCRRHAVRKVLFASSGGAAYGEGQGRAPFHEGDLPQPLDPYGASKVAFEMLLFTYRHNYGLDYAALRYANVYGPRQDPFGEAGVVAIFAQRMAAGQPCTINGDGCKVRDFVYVGDVARANLAALTRGRGLINVGTGVATDINAIFAGLRAAFPGYTLAPVHGPGKPGEVQVSHMAVGLAAEQLGWAAQMSLADGLAHTARAFGAN